VAMITSVNMSTKSVSLLEMRGLSEKQVSDFSALLDKSKDRQEEAGFSAK